MQVGLLPAHNYQQVPFAYKMYTRTSALGWAQSTLFKKAFSIDVDVEFVGVPIIRDKDDMATLATFLRVRSYFGYNLQRLYIQGSGFADEDMVMLSTLVDVTNTDSLVGV